MTQSLTDREFQVLECIASGYDNIETGLELNISTYTVKGHKKTLFQKLGAKNSANAVAIAMRKGILDSRVK